MLESPTVLHQERQARCTQPGSGFTSAADLYGHWLQPGCGFTSAADLYGHWLLWVPLRAPCRRVIKTVHGLLQTMAGLLIALGTVFALLYKLPSSNRHFWSVHAWSGTGAIALYCLQYPLGALEGTDTYNVGARAL